MQQREFLSPQVQRREYLYRCAKCRWLTNEEIAELLLNWKNYQLNVELEKPVTPESGSLFLFDKGKLKGWKDDGHDWRKRSKFNRVREDYLKLRSQGQPTLIGLYTHHNTIKSFHRRTYKLYQSTMPEKLFLVHYLDEEIAKLQPRPSPALGIGIFAGTSIINSGINNNNNNNNNSNRNNSNSHMNHTQLNNHNQNNSNELYSQDLPDLISIPSDSFMSISAPIENEGNRFDLNILNSLMTEEEKTYNQQELYYDNNNNIENNDIDIKIVDFAPSQSYFNESSKVLIYLSSSLVFSGIDSNDIKIGFGPYYMPGYLIGPNLIKTYSPNLDDYHFKNSQNLSDMNQKFPMSVKLSVLRSNETFIAEESVECFDFLNKSHNNTIDINNIESSNYLNNIDNNEINNNEINDNSLDNKNNLQNETRSRKRRINNDSSFDYELNDHEDLVYRQHKIRIVERLGKISNTLSKTQKSDSFDIEEDDDNILEEKLDEKKENTRTGTEIMMDLIKDTVINPTINGSKSNNKKIEYSASLSSQSSWTNMELQNDPLLIDDYSLETMADDELEDILEKLLIKVVQNLVDMAVVDDTCREELILLDSRGYAIIHYACIYNMPSLIPSLISCGCSVEQRSISGMTPLHFAASGGYETLVEMLIVYGADPFIVDNQGLTPAGRAFYSDHKRIGNWLMNHSQHISDQNKKTTGDNKNRIIEYNNNIMDSFNNNSNQSMFNITQNSDFNAKSNDNHDNHDNNHIQGNLNSKNRGNNQMNNIYNEENTSNEHDRTMTKFEKNENHKDDINLQLLQDAFSALSVEDVPALESGAVIIQQTVRAWLNKKNYEQLREAAKKLQVFWREKKKLNLIESSTGSTNIHNNLEFTNNLFNDQTISAANTLQALGRGMLARKQFREIKAQMLASLVIQRNTRNWLAKSKKR